MTGYKIPAPPANLTPSIQAAREADKKRAQDRATAARARMIAGVYGPAFQTVAS